MILQANPLAAYERYREQIDAAIAQVLESGRYILGAEVEAFECAFAGYLGVQHGIGVASGTDAIEVALRALGIGPGDLVYTVSHTAVATVAGIERTGACVEYVDIEPDLFTMSPERLEQTIRSSRRGSSTRPAAVVIVHLYGQPADLPALTKIAHEFDLRIVEDCAQSHGTMLHGRRAGSWGDAAAFSFYPTKNLGALGDGGLVATDDGSIAERAREIRQYGWRERNVSAVRGINSRLDELQAAVLNIKLSGLERDNAQRRKIAGAYSKSLGDTPLQTPVVRPHGDHVFHQYVVQCAARENLRSFLEHRGIHTAIHYPQPVHRQPAYHNGTGYTQRLSVTEAVSPNILSLPMYPELTSREVDSVIEAVLEWTEPSTSQDGSFYRTS